jgi:uncharacterized membrane protein
MIHSIHQYASLAAAFVGSLVETVEAFTIVLAVATVRGWLSALLGALLGFGTLLATAAFFGSAIAQWLRVLTAPEPCRIHGRRLDSLHGQK